MSNKKVWITVGACAVAALALAAALRVAGQSAAVEEPVNSHIPVETVMPQTADLANQMDFVGNLTAGENIVVLPKLTAKVTEVRVKAGDQVKAGDVLFVMDTSDMNSQVELAGLALNSAKASYELTTKYSLEAQEDGAYLQYDQARDAYESAETAYGKLTKNKKETIAAMEQEIASAMEAYVTLAVSTYPELFDDPTKIDPDRALKEAVKDYNLAKGTDTENQAYVKMYDLQQAKDEYENTVSALAGYQASINQASAGLDAAEAGYRAAKVAYRAVSGDAREQQEELAKMQIEQAQLNYNSLMEQLGNAVVTAPADGTVLSVNVQVNNYASPSSSTVMLASGQSMKAVFGLPGRYFGQVQVGDTAFVQATGGTATATVTEVAPMINPQTGTFSVTAEFVNTAGLLSGSTAKVTLTTQHAEGVLTLPVDCVRFEDNKPYVYVLADGFAKKTYITLGMTDEVVYEVADGLGASDRVISTWHPNLTDGAAVAVQ